MRRHPMKAGKYLIVWDFTSKQLTGDYFFFFIVDLSAVAKPGTPWRDSLGGGG